MLEYISSVVAVSVTLGAISFLNYSSASEKAVKLVCVAVLISAVVLPLSTVIGSLDSDLSDFPWQTPEIDADGKYEETAKEAFQDGICKLLCSKYTLSEKDVTVRVYDLDFKNMKAGNIKVLLSGSAALADHRLIEEYLTEQGLGECEVDIRLG